MFAAACRVAASQNINEASLSDIMTITPNRLPKEYSLADLDENLFQDDPRTLTDKFERILVLNTCLSHVKRLHRVSSDDGIARKLMLKASKVILPEGSLIYAEHLTEVERQKSLCQTCLIANLGLSALIHLRSLSKDTKVTLQDQVILNILAFTSISDPWTTQCSLKSAKHLLSLQSTRACDPEFIKDVILFSFIRPLFSTASVPKTITPSSRAALTPTLPPEPHDFSASDLASKPWRLDTCYALSILFWAVKNASQETTLASFHLITPPTLILLDSSNVPSRLQGLRILVAFVQKLTPTLLQQTGLGTVFEDAIYPSLLYLPPITPPADSISILPVAYEAIFELIEARFPSIESNLPKNQDIINRNERLVSLTRLLRHAIVPAHQHTTLSSASNASTQQIIVIQLSLLIRKLGTDSTKHLNVLLPILGDVLLDPFAAASPATMQAAVKALRETVLCAWPRIGEEDRRRAVIKIITGVWVGTRTVSISDVGREAIEKVREELKITAKVFVKAIQALGQIDLSLELRPLLEADQSLRDVFDMPHE